MTCKREEIHIARCQSEAGFTLVELMVTVTILVILLAIGVPQLRTFMVRQQVRADFDSLNSAIQLAKSEALKRSGDVSICPLAANQINCTAANTTDWSNGWMVFIDNPDPAGTNNTFNAQRDTTVHIQQGTRTRAVTYLSGSKFTFEGNGLLKNGFGTFLIQRPGTTDTADCTGMTMSAQGRLRAAPCPDPD
jgi:type IV fimbrial biogenesis protein FimT